MYSYLLPILILSQQCFGIYINITNGENTPQSHFDKPFKPPNGMMSDQGDPVSSGGDPMPSDELNGYFDFFSKYIYGGGIESTPIPLDDMTNATIPPKVMNEGTDLLPFNQPESQVDLGSSKELNHLSDNNTQDVIGVIENVTVNQPETKVEVDVGSLEELYHPSNNNNTQDVSRVSKEFTVNQPESQVEVDVVDNQMVAQWVAALIFIIIALYAVIFIIAVAILECKGKGRRTMDDEKYGSPVEKQKLLNGAAISEDTKDYQLGDKFEKFDKSYTNAALQLESSTTRNYNNNPLLTDRTDLHHLLGSPVAEVEVFPHGSLQRPPKKGCLQY